MDTGSKKHSVIYRLFILILALAMIFAFSSWEIIAYADTETSEEAAEETSEDASDEEAADEESADGEAAEEVPKVYPELLYRPVSKTYVYNSLTGEWGFNSGNVINTRVVGVVVENHPAARPQWGMDDKYYSPDIILEGEVEGGISRMLWMWADYNKMPYFVGPVRSARPPFVRFSELFNAMFVH